MIIRAAKETDVEDLRKLGLAAYGTLKVFMSAGHWREMESVLMAANSFPKLVKESVGFVCEDEGHLKGMAFLVPSGNPTKVYSDDTAYIRMVGVDPSATGKGIARRLLQQCIDKAREFGEAKISLHSAEVMAAARHIYESLGFKKIRILDAHYGLEYWLYEMHLD